MHRVFFIILLLLCSLPLSAEELRYTIKMMGVEIGTSTEAWNTLKTATGCTVQLLSKSQLTISRGAFTVTMSTNTEAVAECGTYTPVSIKSETNEGGGIVTLHASRQGNKLAGTVSKNGISENIAVTLESDLTFFSMIFKKFDTKKFAAPGSLKVISEDSLSVKTISYTSRQEGSFLTVDISYDDIPMQFSLKQSLIVRSLLQGGLLSYELQQLPAGLSELTQPQVAANSSGDMLALTSTENTGTYIKAPRKLKLTTFFIDNTPQEIPAYCNQRVQKDGTLTKVTLTGAINQCVDQADSRYLEPTIFEDSAHPAIQAAAKRIRQEKSPEATIRNTVAFVYTHIKEKNYRHGQLSASEVLAGQAGDCTEHATLLSALLKAQGFMTRMVYGLILADDNRFYFHNWNEVYLNKQWTSADATNNTFPADTARIALMAGMTTVAEREKISLTIIKFLKGPKIGVTGYSK